MEIDVYQLLSLPNLLEVRAIESTENRLKIMAYSIQNKVCCPVCSTPASRIHSRYQRTVNDLGCVGQVVQLQVTVRKFFCELSNCPRKIFVERLGSFIAPWARVTNRLYQAVQKLGLATSGMLGARLGVHFGILTSWMTILRRIMTLPSEPLESLQELGIDDFALRRGRTYGSILVNLQTHQIIDLLPDRDISTVARWLAKHPGITIISRDRGGDYAKGSRLGAPQAIQIADRFHLYRNLIEAAERTLASCRSAIRRSFSNQIALPASEPLPIIVQKLEFQGIDNWQPVRDPWAERQRLQHREQQYDRYQQILELLAQGLTQAEVAKRVGISRRTISRWLSQGTFPEVHYKKQRNQFDAYAAYVLKRWEAGEHNGRILWQEIRQQGYRGSRSMVYRFLRSLRHDTRIISLTTSPKSDLPFVPLQDFSSKTAIWLFARDPSTLSPREQITLSTICEVNETARQTYDLIQEFRQLLHQRAGDKLEGWLVKVKESQIAELQKFVRGIERDKAAVVAGLSLPQSNGMVEGQVNKLKLIKRMMFGRAKFALLRQRVLHAL